MNVKIQNLIDQLNAIQTGKNWIGSSYKTKLSSIDESFVFTRPLKDLHSIAELISHMTLWRKEAILKVKTGSGSKTDDCEENWLGNEVLKEKGWQSIKSEYDNSLKELIQLLRSKDDSFLDQLYYDTDFKGDYEYSFVLNGMLHHDLYHLGQIGIIIKYLKLN